MQIGEDWMARGSCVGKSPELFFKEHASHWHMQQALDICKHCLVKDPCLDYALKHNIRFGIWGGKTPNQRSRIQKKGR